MKCNIVDCHAIFRKQYKSILKSVSYDHKFLVYEFLSRELLFSHKHTFVRQSASENEIPIFNLSSIKQSCVVIGCKISRRSEFSLNWLIHHAADFHAKDTFWWKVEVLGFNVFLYSLRNIFVFTLNNNQGESSSSLLSHIDAKFGMASAWLDGRELRIEWKCQQLYLFSLLFPKAMPLNAFSKQGMQLCYSWNCFQISS